MEGNSKEQEEQQKQPFELNAVIVVPTFCGQGHRRIITQGMPTCFLSTYLLSTGLRFLFLLIKKAEEGLKI